MHLPSVDVCRLYQVTRQPLPRLEIAAVSDIAVLCCRYASFYLTRNSLAFTAPTMLEDKALGLDMTAVGGLTSILPVAYGFSKFLSGVLGARTSPRFLLAGAPASCIHHPLLAHPTALCLCACWTHAHNKPATPSPAACSLGSVKRRLDWSQPRACDQGTLSYCIPVLAAATPPVPLCQSQ